MDCPFNQTDGVSVLRYAWDSSLGVIQLRKFLGDISRKVSIL